MSSPPPSKRERPVRMIKAPTQPVSDLPFLDFGESSDDSDFHIEDLHDGSDDSFNSEDDNKSSAGESGNSDLEEGEIVDVNDGSGEKTVSQLIDQAKLQGSRLDLRSTAICSVCLGARNEHDNEIVECDRCGVSVHECCYGVSYDAVSVSSTDSDAPTEPWFCEPCKEGVLEPNCELCPNTGGILKATDVGRWVHLVCALYVPAIAFGEVERLANVTLFEMPYNKWGSKPCGLCGDERLARCGVQIACDAGMCKQHFHVTCGQREGLLSEAWSEEVDQADPFYAHCKLHTDKAVMHRRRTNYIILAVRQAQRRAELETELSSNTPAALRIERKLKKKQSKYKLARQNAVPPWVPTQKMPRLLTTSATACRALWRKAALMDIDVLACEGKEARAAVLHEIANKWHIPPAFSVEFTAYFMDRNSRIPTLKGKLQALLDRNAELARQHETMEAKYGAVVAAKEECEGVNTRYKEVIETYHKVIKLVEPNKRLPIVQDLILHARATHTSPMMVPTAAALKAGVGYPILRTNYKGQQQTEPRVHAKQEQPTVAVSCHECGICRGTKDQHLLTRCDACHLYYHLGCLTPPLTRMPKKTKLQGWECSECDKEGSPYDAGVSGPRRPRYKSPPSLPEAFYVRPDRADASAKRRHRDRVHGKKKRKKLATPPPPAPMTSENMPHIRIRIKAIPSLDGLAAGTTFVASSTEDELKLTPVSDPLEDPLAATPMRPGRPTRTSLTPADATPRDCHTCHGDGDARTLVRCDECGKNYHFGCLDPPLKKTPKVRGYSWHCAACDPSDGEKK